MSAKRDYERTSARVVQGQPMPEPVQPLGDGWILLSTVPGHDAEGKPCLWFTWFKNLEQQAAPEEDLEQ